MKSSTATRTALVLAGGGSFGAVQAGVLRALVAHGVVPDLVVGSSVGAMCPLAISPYDFSHAGELIDRAADQTRRWLDKGGLARRRVPGALRGHTH